MAAEPDGTLRAPQSLTNAQGLRLATSIREGFAPLIRASLEAEPRRSPATEWALMQPYVLEAERTLSDRPDPRPGRPRRTVTPRPGLVVRREVTRGGYVLRFTGREATSDLLDEVMGEIERVLLL